MWLTDSPPSLVAAAAVTAAAVSTKCCGRDEKPRSTSGGSELYEEVATVQIPCTDMLAVIRPVGRCHPTRLLEDDTKSERHWRWFEDSSP